MMKAIEELHINIINLLDNSTTAVMVVEFVVEGLEPRNKLLSILWTHQEFPFAVTVLEASSESLEAPFFPSSKIRFGTGFRSLTTLNISSVFKM